MLQTLHVVCIFYHIELAVTYYKRTPMMTTEFYCLHEGDKWRFCFNLDRKAFCIMYIY